MNFAIQPVSSKLAPAIRKKIDTKTKPVGSLGKLENIALKISLIQETTEPKIDNPHIIVFAGDHGIANEGVSAFPQEVTYQMVYNFINGGAAINVFSNQHHIKLQVVDAGVKFDFGNSPLLTHAKIGWGTKSFLHEPAMTVDEYEQAVLKGAEIVKKVGQENCNLIGFGEMGIGNTSAASIIMSLVCNIPLKECVGKGTGMEGSLLLGKIKILEQALSHHKIDTNNIKEVLTTFGGFEMVMMYGAMLQAAEMKMAIVVDGFIATAVFLAAHKQHPEIIDFAIFSHCSDERGHKAMLDFLKTSPLLNLGLRLGEGTGCALCYPLIQSALKMMSHMASFESAGISDKED